MSNKPSRDTRNQVSKYLLRDYQFLQDYIILPELQEQQNNKKTNNNTSMANQSKSNKCRQQFLARIVNTTQNVKFNKIVYKDQYLQRFIALRQLYQKGIILADNVFILDETDAYYYYIIEAHINYQENNQQCEQQEEQSQENVPTPKFLTLQMWLQQRQPNFSQKNKVLTKLKVLLDHIHSTGQTYNNLTSNQIVFDNEDNIYLTPYNLQQQLQEHEPYQRAYYSPEILELFNCINNKRQEVTLQNVTTSTLVKNDIWAFGCIVCQLFYYSMPIFYRYQLAQQKLAIKQFIQNLQEEKQQIWQNQQIGNLIMNCLCMEIDKRKISSEKPFKLKVKMLAQQNINNKRNIASKDKSDTQRTIKVINTNTATNKENKDKINLQVKILHLYIPVGSDINPKQKQFRINIYLNRQYSIFISTEQSIYQKKGSLQSYHLLKVNKTINIQQTYQQLQQLLKQPILFEVQQLGIGQQLNENGCKIRVNLGSLILLSQRDKIWEKPLIGTYTQNNSNNNKAQNNMSIKLSCCLKQIKQNSTQTIREYNTNNNSIKSHKADIIAHNRQISDYNSTIKIKNNNNLLYQYLNLNQQQQQQYQCQQREEQYKQPNIIKQSKTNNILMINNGKKQKQSQQPIVNKNNQQLEKVNEDLLAIINKWDHKINNNKNNIPCQQQKKKIKQNKVNMVEKQQIQNDGTNNQNCTIKDRIKQILTKRHISV